MRHRRPCMLTMRNSVLTLVTGLIVLYVDTIVAQDYPNKPIHIVTGPAGGGSDFHTRLIARGLSVPLKQSVVVDNRANVLIGELVAKAPPDGYTLMINGTNF